MSIKYPSKNKYLYRCASHRQKILHHNDTRHKDASLQHHMTSNLIDITSIQRDHVAKQQYNDPRTHHNDKGPHLKMQASQCHIDVVWCQTSQVNSRVIENHCKLRQTFNTLCHTSVAFVGNVLCKRPFYR